MRNTYVHSVLLQHDRCLRVRTRVTENRVIKIWSDQNKFCPSLNLTTSHRSLKSLTANTLTRSSRYKNCIHLIISHVTDSVRNSRTVYRPTSNSSHMTACHSIHAPPHGPNHHHFLGFLFMFLRILVTAFTIDHGFLGLSLSNVSRLSSAFVSHTRSPCAMLTSSVFLTQDSCHRHNIHALMYGSFHS